VPTEAEARRIADELRESVGAFKVGLQLFTAAGPELVRDLVNSGARVFLDLKFHDIPNTVAAASVEAARLGVWMFNVHAFGGSEMMRRAANQLREACGREALRRPLIIGVTVLTSSNRETLNEIGIAEEPFGQAVRLARLAAECGLDGVVASPHEAAGMKSEIGKPEFLIVTPGIRPVDATNDDQKRVMTAGGAVAAGADYLVIGRPILEAPDRSAAVQAIISEIESVSK
jgi:orotidine-5'-phosphate decarboxylase